MFNTKMFFYLSLTFQLMASTPNWEKVIEESIKKPEDFFMKPIIGGASNLNYRFEVEGKPYFLRVASPSLQDIYGSPQIEYQVTNQLQNLGVVPCLHYYDEKKLILVSDFIEKEPIQIDLLDTQTRKEVFELLHRIESSNFSISRVFNPYEDVLKLLQVAKKPLSSSFYQELLPTLKKVDQIVSGFETKKVICHLDLHAGNLLKGQGQYWIVDWEYATMSDPILVLASMASIERWDDLEMKKALGEYKIGATDQDFYKLYLYRFIADVFWTVWNHIQSYESKIDRPYQEWKLLFEKAAFERMNKIQAKSF